MKFYKVAFKSGNNVIGAVTGVTAFNKLDAVKKARQMIDMPSNICLLGFAQEIKFSVGDTFPPMMVRS